MNDFRHLNIKTQFFPKASLKDFSARRSPNGTYTLYQEKGLTDRASIVYSYLYTHSIFYDDGWCGFSDANISKSLGKSVDYVVRGLKELKDKKMIIIRNPGTRTKKTGKSREIHINPKNYLVEELEEVKTDNKSLKLIEQLKKDNEELRKENSRLKLEYAQSVHITELGYLLIRTGFISKEQYKTQADELNHILLDFESWHKGGRGLSKACFNYWNVHKDTKVKNYVKYILACIDASKEWINRKDTTVENYENKLKQSVDRWYGKNG